MHVAIGIFRTSQPRGAEALALLRTRPGFVTGYWTHDAAGDRSYAFTLWDCGAAAAALADVVAQLRLEVEGFSITALEAAVYS